jgi:CRP-like cAMP-binding protein
LRRIPLLSNLSDEELVSLAAMLARRRAPKGSFIVYADDPGPSLMFLLRGKVKITLGSDDGKEAVLANLEDGDFFGELALLTGEDRSANVVALGDCELLVLSKEDFHQHLMKNNGLVFAMARELALRLRSASNRIGDLALYDVYRRVARTLKSLGTQAEGQEPPIFVIEDRPTHQELANMVGTSREMVTRAMKDLEEEGCIVVEGKRIEVRRIPL